MIQKITLPIFAIAAIAGVLIMAYGVLTYDHLRTKEVTNEARFQCAQSSRYQVTQPDGSVVWYPVEELYNKCLKEKGL